MKGLRKGGLRQAHLGPHCACGGSCPRCAPDADTDDAGEPVPAALASRFSGAPAAALAGVRLHTNEVSQAAARELDAKALTVGGDIHFAAGRYRPGTADGDRLIAHEVAHAVQRGAPSSDTTRVASPGDPAEVEARAAASSWLAGHTFVPMQHREAAVYRDPNGPGDAPDELQPFRIPGTPLTVIPLERANANESITLFGVRLPYRAIRLTNQNEITPAPALPQTWRDVPDLFRPAPGLKNRLSTGAPFTGRNISDVIGLQPAPPGQPAATIPRFSITARTDGFALDITDRVPLELRPDVVPGTPLGGATDEGNVKRHSIANASFAVRDRAFLAGTLSLHDQYPSHYTDPTEIDVTFRSETLRSLRARETKDRLDFGTIGSIRAGAFGIGAAKGEVSAFIDLTRVDAALAPLGMDRGQSKAARDEIVGLIQQKIASLKQQPSLGNVLGALSAISSRGALTSSLQQVLQKYARPGTQPIAVQHAAENVIAELLGPGFEVRGPIFFGIPIGYGFFRAPTTRYLRAPFEGSGIGLPYPSTLATIGPTLIPKGVITDFTTPAGGGTIARDWESIALSATIAGKPSLEPSSIGVAGVATGRIGFRVHGFDVVIEGGWRGRAALGAGKADDDPVRRDFLAIAAARQQAQARYNEDVEGKEAGVFAPGLVPAEVLPQGRPDAEFYGVFRIIKRFYGP